MMSNIQKDRIKTAIQLLKNSNIELNKHTQKTSVDATLMWANDDIKRAIQILDGVVS